MDGVALHLSAVHFPVLMVTWFGTSTGESVRRYAQWLGRMGDRAEVEGTQFVLLGDTTSLESRPGPEVRRVLLQVVDQIAADYPQSFLGGTTVMTHPLMRAALIMVMTLSRRPFEMKAARDMTQAIERTFELLDAAGVPRPPGLDASTYQPPPRPE